MIFVFVSYTKDALNNITNIYMFVYMQAYVHLYVLYFSLTYLLGVEK